MVDVIRNSNKIAILTHSNADPDAIASSYALFKIIKKLNPTCECYIVLHEGMSKLSRLLIRSLSLEEYLFVSKWPSNTGPEVIIIVATASSTQLGVSSRYLSTSKCIVIDHHETGDLITRGCISILISNAKATSEIITYIYALLNINIDHDIATLLIAGILYDTKHLALADKDLLCTLLFLLEQEGSMTRARKALYKEVDISERIARIKASLRAKVFKYNETLIAITCIGAYEASVANSLLELGYDLVLVISSNEHTRVIFRTTPRFIKLTGINVHRDIIKPVLEALGGSGGGHELAGGALVLADAREVYFKIIESLRNKLGKELRELTPGTCP